MFFLKFHVHMHIHAHAYKVLKIKKGKSESGKHTSCEYNRKAKACNYL